MGAQQAYEWACQEPTSVDRLAIICGAAKTSEHNKVFLKSLITAISADHSWKAGDYDRPPLAGLRAAGRIYAGWAYSQDWYRENRHYTMSDYHSLDQYLEGYWDRLFEARDANNILSMVDTWLSHDISVAKHQGNLIRALQSIKAKTLLMPCDRDLYFRTADNVAELQYLRNGTLAELSSIWGHMAGSGQSLDDNLVLNQKLFDLLHRTD